MTLFAKKELIDDIKSDILHTGKFTVEVIDKLYLRIK